MAACAHCGVALEPVRRTRRFCTTACRTRAFRRRQAGVPEDVFRAGAARGPTRLSEETRGEQVAALVSARLAS